MNPAELVSSPPHPRRDAPHSWRGRAFGLELSGDLAIPAASVNGGPPVARTLLLERTSPEDIARAWAPRSPEPLLIRRYTDGRRIMTIERDPLLGYRVFAPHHGTYVVANDGRCVLCAPPRLAPSRWQRLVFAQVLPLAAALQGLGVLHASAVELDGRAVAFTAPSGTGKSSLAAHLVGAGARFVADDVVALEALADGVLAHVGAATASIDRVEWRAMTPSGRRRMGRVVARTDKIHLATDRVELPLRLGALYSLERNGATELRCDESSPPDPLLLLRNSFLSYLAAPEHLQTHLDVCARMAGSVRVFGLHVPTGMTSVELAEAVGPHARSVLAEAAAQ